MKRQALQLSYEQRFARVIEYIYEHLDQNLDLERLADIAHLSAFHCHRIYRSMYGETLAATVKRLRLHRAAYLLAHEKQSIGAIAKTSGYPNLQSFTRTFQAVYGMPPARYRSHGSHTQFANQPIERLHTMHPVNVLNIAAFEVVGAQHIGDYMNIGKAFDTVYSTLGARGLLNERTRSIGVYRDDPGSTPVEELRSMAAVTIDMPNAQPLPPQCSVEKISAGLYARLDYQGPYADMHSAYMWLYGTWLPESGYEAGDAPVFEEYLNDPRNTPPTELRTDIYLPLKAIET